MATSSTLRAASDAADPSRPTEPAPDYLIDLKEVCRRVGLSRSSINELIAAGRFPRRVKPTPEATRWSAKAIDRWVQERIAAAEGPGL